VLRNQTSYLYPNSDQVWMSTNHSKCAYLEGPANK
jgi:hypothetical protein